MLLCPVKNLCRLTQKFGERPEVYSQFGLKSHNGVDWSGKNPGDKVPLYAPLEGYLEIGDQGAKGYGKHVRIKTKQYDNKGRLKEVILGHFDSIDPRWKTGDFVPMGEKLGIMGTTGFSSGVHVHMGLRFLNAAGTVLDYDNGWKGYIDFHPFIIYWG